MPPRGNRRGWNYNQNHQQETVKRKERALAHPILLLDYYKSEDEKSIQLFVLGTSGTTYNVMYGSTEKQWTCDCPDYLRRQTFCKHIYFVLARVLQKDVVGDDLDVKSTRYDDINELWIMIRDRIQQTGTIKNPSVLESNEVKDEQKVKQREYIGEACCFCLDPMTPLCQIVYCEKQCGKSVHSLCFQRYVKTTKKKIADAKCPYCRTLMNPASLQKQLYTHAKKRQKIEEIVIQEEVLVLETKEEKKT